MSRIILSPLHYLAIAALAIPLLSVGYIAGNGDLLAVYRLNLELSLSGKGADFDGKKADASQPILPIIAEANDLFDVKGKGPRADLLYRQRVINKTDFQARRLRAEMAFVDRVSPAKKLSNKNSVTNVYASKQKVNRGTKANRTIVASVAVSEDPVAIPTVGKFAAGLPIINQNRVASVFDVNRRGDFMAAPDAASGIDIRTAAREGKKPAFTGLEVKHVASLAKGKRKFFGGLTEGEFRRREARCLATAIYFEARSEPVKGQIAVAQVIMNRVRSRYYADTVCGVVYEGAHKRNSCQFSFACDGIADKPKDKKRWVIAEKLAGQVTEGKVWLSDIGHASHYHAAYVSPKWRRSMKRIKRIGQHIFYKAKYFTQPTEIAIR